jgi:uncharacterized membrane protein YdbT with pleckstrin-like domain
LTRLLEGEQPIRVARQHWVVFIPVVLVCAVVLGVGLALLKVLPSSVSGHSLHQIKVVIALILVLFSLATFSLRWLRWRFTTYTLTNRRILVSTGVLSRTTESITLDRIQDLTVRQSILARIFRAGDVEIESAGREGTEVLDLISDPQGFSDSLQSAVEAHRAGPAYPAAPPAGGAPLPQGYVPPGGPGFGPPPGTPRPGGGL